MTRDTMNVNLIKYLAGRTSYEKRYDGCQSYKISTWYVSYCVTRFLICYTNKERTGWATYKDFQTLEFNTKLPANQYMNLNKIHICCPFYIKSTTNVANGVPDCTMTNHNFFSHWMKEIDIKRYEDDL